jgi:hypothetical protein
MMRALLVRGMLAGALAGVLACLFAKVFGEPQIDRAIAFEDHLAALGGAAHEDGPIGRGTQSTVGLLVALVVYGTAIGGILSLVFAYAYGRVALRGARPVAAALAAGGFVAVGLVPFLKYPASPPAVGTDATIGSRTGLWFVLVAITICAGLAAVRVARERRAAWGAWNAAVAGGAAFVVLVAVAAALLPAVDEVPRNFPADVLWRFRLAALGMQAVLWAACGLLLGAFADRVLARHGEAGLARPLGSPN